MIKFFLGTVVPITVAVPIVVGIILFKKLPLYLRIIVFFVLVSAITSGTTFLLIKMVGNNMPAFHFFTAVTFIVSSLFYKEALVGTKIEKAIVPLIFAFLVFAVISTICWQGIFVFNSYTLTLETFIMIVYSLLLFYKLLGTDLNSSKNNTPLIWVNTAFLLYFSGSLFLFAFPQLLTAPDWVYATGWIIHASLVLLMYIFFTIAFIKYKAPK